MSARKGKGFGLTQLRGPQPRPEAPDLAAIGEQRLPGAFEVAIEQVVPDAAQPRRDWAFDDGDQKLQELAASIREFGIFQPLVVREDGALDDRRTRYIVIAGGRRRAAAEIAELRVLPVLVRGEEGARLRVMQLIENLQRQELSPLDEARALQELLDAENLSAPQLAGRIHKSAQHIRSRLRILADQVIADAIERRQIPVTAARMIQQLPDEEVLRFRTRLRDGETLHLADVIGARARLRAEGVENPRYKGGGRRNLVADGAPIIDAPTPVAEMLDPRGEHDREQTVFVPSPPQETAQREMALIEDEGGIPDVDAMQVDHPAAKYAVARAIGALIRRNMPEHIRQEIDARLAALGEPSDWLPGLYTGIADKQHVHDDTK
jgi:ParB/RepB/Spo0J family partition protein